MTVKDWVKFLQNDKKIKKIGLQMEGGLKCLESSFVEKEKFEESLFKWYEDEEVVMFWYGYYNKNDALLIYKNPDNRG